MSFDSWIEWPWLRACVLVDGAMNELGPNTPKEVCLWWPEIATWGSGEREWQAEADLMENVLWLYKQLRGPDPMAGRLGAEPRRWKAYLDSLVIPELVPP